LDFDANNIALVTLVGYFEGINGQNPRHIQIPITPEVQNELKGMLGVTALKLGLPESAGELPLFSPAEKYSSEDHLRLPLDTDYVEGLQNLVALQNLPSDANALNSISELAFYYAIFTDNQQRRVWAFRRASQFKGVVKSKLAFLVNGMLSMLDGAVFKLDNDFDYLVDAETIFILRPSGFEFTTDVHGQMLQVAAENAATIAASVVYLDVARITLYARKHPRAARLLAAIRSRDDLHLIDRDLLINACQSWGINVLQNAVGLIGPDDGHEYDFLCVLDRRAYTANLIPDQPEHYEAASRALR
jgi:hypothetical protein